MLDLIKRASMGAILAGNPVNILYGEILSISDSSTEKIEGEVTYFNWHINKIEIKVDQKLILDKDFFIIPESLNKYEILIKHRHRYNNSTCETEDKLLGKITIREGLKKGNKILLLSVQGGQQYVILDKVV